MKKILLPVSICLFLNVYINIANAQSSQLWGMTSTGGGYGIGTLLKINNNGSGFSNPYTFISNSGSYPYGSLIQASNGLLYGMTSQGGSSNVGNIFSFNPSTSAYADLFDFNGTNGANPQGSLILSSDGTTFYGMTSQGGSHGMGNVFSFNPTSSAYADLLDFNGSNGANPLGSLTLSGDGTTLYGMTSQGGANSMGNIFSISTSGSAYADLLDFSGGNGTNPQGNLTLSGDGTTLYGMTSAGGANSMGNIFSISTSGSAYADLVDFNGSNGDDPEGSLTLSSDGTTLYGMTNQGGSNSMGLIFSFVPSSSTYADLLDFNGSNGANPLGSLTLSGDGTTLYGMTFNGGDNYDGVIFSIGTSGSAYADLYDFNTLNNDGYYPLGSLVQASNGKLYGMASQGGSNSNGAIFSFNPSTSAYANLFNLSNSSGDNPLGSMIQASDGKLYGMTSAGGSTNQGVIFSLDPASNTYTDLYDFKFASGGSPYGSLIQASDGKLYGMTYDGGSNNVGVIFRFDPSSNTYTDLYDLRDSTGRYPWGGLIQASDGKLYGMTYVGGAYESGVIFSFDPSSSVYADLVDFNGTNGANPLGNLIQASDGKLYGMTPFGGSNGLGNIFSYDPSTTSFIDLLDLDDSYGDTPIGSLIQASDGKLYGMTSSGGAYEFGVIFNFDPSNSAYTDLLDFNGLNGAAPTGDLILPSNGTTLYGMTNFGGGNNDGVVFSMSIFGSSYAGLYDFNSLNNNGYNPNGSLVQASNGKLYGMASYGGDSLEGTIFSFNPASFSYSELLDFNGNKGADANGNLMLASNAKFYGMTSQGGSSNNGLIFSFDSSSSVYTDLFEFNLSDGATPYGSLIQASDGKLYGMTNGGGVNLGGVIFSFDPSSSAYNDLHDFSVASGEYPWGSLIQASDGKLYGMTSQGGAHSGGVIFRFDPSSSAYTNLYDLNGSSGDNPYGSLIQANNGKLYGMTYQGGANNSGVIFSFDPSSSTYVDLFDLNGDFPSGSLIQASDGKFYGMSADGGSNGSGDIFRFDPSSSTYSDLHDFNGDYPNGSLIQASDGKLYGMTPYGGSNGDGVIFKFDYSSNTYTDLMDLASVDGINPLGDLLAVHTTQQQSATLNITMYIEGYYLGGGMMRQVLYNQSVDPNPNSIAVDTVTVTLVDPTLLASDPDDNYADEDTVATATGVLQTNGSLTVTFPGFTIGHTYWLYATNRTMLQTWWNSTITITNGASFNFSQSPDPSYGHNQVDVYSEGIYSMFSGDVNQDESVDGNDLGELQYDVYYFAFGYCNNGSNAPINTSEGPVYSTDLNGDGGIDGNDLGILQANIYYFIFSYHP